MSNWLLCKPFPEVAGQFYLFFLTDRPDDFNQSAPLYVPTPNSDREAFMPIYINLLLEDIENEKKNDLAL